jgi:acetolactate synthase-1/2/3 large subunit
VYVNPVPGIFCYFSDKSSVGYPGGAALPLFDGIYKTKLFRFILSHHEQGAGHMAEGYACASRKPGVVLVTSGPGSSNLATPLLNALLDGTQIVVICGQVATTAQGTGAFQEIDIMALAKTCTKWCACVQRVEDLPMVIHNAFDQATSKRPGPVLVAIPMDVGKAVLQSFPLDDSLIHSLEYQNMSLGGFDGTSDTQKELDHIAMLVKRSQRPVICAGHGVLADESCPGLLSRIAQENKIPVTTTLLGVGCFDETHELALHMVGTYGSPYANYAVQNADLILVFGARLDERAVGNPSGYAPKAKEAAQAGQGGIIHFDIDPSAVGKVIEPTQIVVGDLSETLPKLLCRLDGQQNRDAWLDQVQKWKKVHAFQVPRPERHNLASPQQIIAEMDRQTSSSKHCTTITTGVGQHQMWAAQRYRFRYPNSLVTSGALGTMGFGLPAAIGAQLGRPDHTVIDIDGDASFCMTMEELLTASNYDIPVKIIVFNNDTQGMIAQIQQSDYEGRVCHNRQANPNFVLLAHSMGCESQQCERGEDLSGCIQWLLACRRPALLDVLIPETEMRPLVPNGQSLEFVALE